MSKRAIPTFNDPGTIYQAENIARNEEKVGTQHFLLLHRCLPPYRRMKLSL